MAGTTNGGSDVEDEAASPLRVVAIAAATVAETVLAQVEIALLASIIAVEPDDDEGGLSIVVVVVVFAATGGEDVRILREAAVRRAIGRTNSVFVPVNGVSGYVLPAVLPAIDRTGNAVLAAE